MLILNIRLIFAEQKHYRTLVEHRLVMNKVVHLDWKWIDERSLVSELYLKK